VPVAIVITRSLVHRRLPRRRWVIHACVVSALLLVPFAAIYLQGVLDPSTIQNPGPGDGFALLLYIPVMVLSGLA
jgi:hypothetical protein